MILAGAVGFFGATAHGMIQAQSRLMGYSPNAVSEMQKVRLPLRHATKRAHAQPSSPLCRYCRGSQTGFAWSQSVVDPNDESMDYLKQYATRFVPRQEVEAAE